MAAVPVAAALAAVNPVPASAAVPAAADQALVAAGVVDAPRAEAPAPASAAVAEAVVAAAAVAEAEAVAAVAAEETARQTFPTGQLYSLTGSSSLIGDGPIFCVWAGVEVSWRDRALLFDNIMHVIRS